MRKFKVDEVENKLCVDFSCWVKAFAMHWDSQENKAKVAWEPPVECVIAENKRLSIAVRSKVSKAKFTALPPENQTQSEAKLCRVRK